VAAAAYRAGVKLEDLRIAQVFDFTRRSGVVVAEIVAPAGAGEFSQDRAALWNAAEAAEKRKDSRTAREWILALPSELDAGQRADLARGFARELVARYGVIADVAIHAPSRGGDDRNHHAHILCTTRVAVVDTLGEKCELELSDAKRKTLGLAPAADEILAIRERWANLANAALQEAGSAARIDHRSLADQQTAAFETGDLAEALTLDRPAQVHVGVHGTQLDRRAGQVVSLRGLRRAHAQKAARQATSSAARWAPILIDAVRSEAEVLVRAEIGEVWASPSATPANDVPIRRAAEIVDLEARRGHREQASASNETAELEQLRREMLEVVPPGMDFRAAFRDYQRQQEIKKRAEKEAAEEAKRAAEEITQKAALWHEYQERYHAQKNAEKRASLEAEVQPAHKDEDRWMDLESKEPTTHVEGVGQLTMNQLKAEKLRLERWPDPGQMAEDDPRFKEAQVKSYAAAEELSQLNQSIQKLRSELKDHKAAHSLRTWLHETTLAGRALVHDRERMAMEDAERKQEKQLAEQLTAWEELEQQNRKLREQLKAEKQEDARREMTGRAPRLEAFNAEIQRREAQADTERLHSNSYQQLSQPAQPQRIDDDRDMDF
jgi:hypothetical protein